ncbi:hypothetical protein T08_4233 [Trichinella sp. T8]|nr:hypothetical protein T08_4233 [Trichinella sp. T8]
MHNVTYPASDYLNKVQKAFRSAVASHISKWFRNWELAKHLRLTCNYKSVRIVNYDPYLLLDVSSFVMQPQN